MKSQHRLCHWPPFWPPNSFISLPIKYSLLTLFPRKRTPRPVQSQQPSQSPELCTDQASPGRTGAAAFALLSYDLRGNLSATHPPLIDPLQRCLGQQAGVKPSHVEKGGRDVSDLSLACRCPAVPQDRHGDASLLWVPGWWGWGDPITPCPCSPVPHGHGPRILPLRAAPGSLPPTATEEWALGGVFFQQYTLGAHFLFREDGNSKNSS